MEHIKYQINIDEQNVFLLTVTLIMICLGIVIITDADLVRKARATKKGKKWFTRCRTKSV